VRRRERVFMVWMGMGKKRRTRGQAGRGIQPEIGQPATLRQLCAL
jgi:hypothetical protein